MTRASLADCTMMFALLARPGDVFELRGLSKVNGQPQVHSGYFDDVGELARAAAARSGQDHGVYVTINPVNPALLARADKNRVRRAGSGDTTSDRDVQRRRALLVDVDPVRPTGISSTDEEHDGAIAIIRQIAADLGALGWPDPIVGDSGNGGHLIYGIDLPVDDGGLVKRVLEHLSKRYTTPAIKVDEKVFNPARISKIYGTLTRKGADTPERPHRLARIITAPTELAIVTREQLEAFAPIATPAKREQPSHRDYQSHGPRPTFELEAFLAAHLPDATEQSWTEGRKWLLPVCPFNDSHDRKEAFIVQFPSGAVEAGCLHESCKWKWRELRQKFEPDAYDRAPTNGNGQRLSDREPPPEVLYEDQDYAAEHAPTLTKPPAPKPRFRLLTVWDALEELGKLAGVPIYPTPFAALNEAIGFKGFLGTQVYTVAAGTGRGKTTWVAAVAAHAASEGWPVIVASYEMKPGYFVARHAAGKLGVHSNAIIRGEISSGDVTAVTQPISQRLWLMHRPPLSELEAAIMHVQERFEVPPLVIVDYIQKLADVILRTQQRPDLRLATTEASATLLEIAERTNSAIVAVSSIGRGKGKVLSNPRRCHPYELVEVAKESGAVEYDGAGMIVLSLSDEVDGDARIGTMTIAKARFGVECHIDARFDGRTGQWTALERVTRTAKAESEAEHEPETTQGQWRAKIVNLLQAGARVEATQKALAKALTTRPDKIRDALKILTTDELVESKGGFFQLSEKGRQLTLGVDQ